MTDIPADIEQAATIATIETYDDMSAALVLLVHGANAGPWKKVAMRSGFSDLGFKYIRPVIARAILAERLRCADFAHAKHDWPARWIASSFRGENSAYIDFDCDPDAIRSERAGE